MKTIVYQCDSCGLEELWDTQKTMEWSTLENKLIQTNWPEFTTCPYCEGLFCVECFENHDCGGK